MSETKFEDALSDCIEMLGAGAGLAECAARHPEHAEELGPLLAAARATMRLSDGVAPGDGARARGMVRMRGALDAKRAADAERRRGRGWDGLGGWLGRLRLPRLGFGGMGLPRLAGGPMAAALAAVFLATVAAGGATVASSDSVPGEPLYWVKSARESCERGIARSDEWKARVHARHARERGREIGELAMRGKMADAERVVERLRGHLSASATYVGVALPEHPVEMPRGAVGAGRGAGSDALRARLADDEAYVRGRLNALLADAPEGMRVRVWRLMHETDLGYRVVIVALDGRGGAVSYGYEAVRQR